MRTRDELCKTLDGNFKKLMDCLGQLTEDELTGCTVAGTWTVKDVIIHIWTKGDEAAKTAKAWQGPRPWQAGAVYDDAWNEAQVASKFVLPLITVMDGVLGAHRRLMHQLDLASDEKLQHVARAPWNGQMTLADFIDAMAEHYLDHVSDLASYQERCLQSGT